MNHQCLHRSAENIIRPGERSIQVIYVQLDLFLSVFVNAMLAAPRCPRSFCGLDASCGLTLQMHHVGCSFKT